MVKIALIGLTCMFLCVTLGGIKREYAIFVAVAGCFLIFYLGISQMEFITKTMYELQSVIGINGTYISILLKMVGIASVSYTHLWYWNILLKVLPEQNFRLHLRFVKLLWMSGEQIKIEKSLSICRLL